MVEVSVIVPVYNAASYIDLLIHDLHEQTYKNVEFLLINDGSSDDSYNLMNKWVSCYADNRFVIIDKANGGVSSARNKGLGVSRGIYVIFVDSDDRLKPDFVSRYVNSIKNSKADMSVFSAIRVFDNHNFKVKSKIDYSKIASKQNISVGDMIKYFSDLKAWGYPFCYITKRSLWKNITFNEHIKFQEDVLAFFEIWNNHPNMKIKINKEAYYYYVDRDNSALHTMNVSDYWQFVDVDNKIISMIQENKRLKVYGSYIKALKISSLISVIAQSILDDDTGNYKKARKEFLKTFFSAKYISKRIKRRRALQYILVVLNLKQVIKLVYKYVYEN